MGWHVPRPPRPAARSAVAGRAPDDRGGVTVEAAIAMGTLVLVTVVAVGAVATVTASVCCTDAARELARMSARGEPERGRDLAARLAPDGARIELTRTGDEIVADVSATPFSLIPVPIRARAVAVLEPGTPEETP